jgi:hypothetical protein
MKLSFPPAELVLHDADGDFVLEMAGKELGRFKQEKRAVSEYNRIRRELEKKLPPTEVTDQERRALLESYLADKLVGVYSARVPKKKTGRTRTFG